MSLLSLLRFKAKNVAVQTFRSDAVRAWDFICHRDFVANKKLIVLPVLFRFFISRKSSICGLNYITLTHIWLLCEVLLFHLCEKHVSIQIFIKKTFSFRLKAFCVRSNHKKPQKNKVQNSLFRFTCSYIAENTDSQMFTDLLATV